MNHLNKIFLISYFAFLPSFSESYKILAVFPTTYSSHWKIGVSISKQLALAGHDVTTISPFEINEPNIRNVLLSNVPKGEY